MSVQQLFSILRQYGSSIGQGVITLSILFVVFTFMERVFAFNAGKKPWRATLLDLQYAFLSMLYPPFVYFILSAFFGFLELRFEANPSNPRISIPLFAGEVLMLLFVRDCLIYIRHRIFHLRPVWAFHSIHHSSEEVNWTSAVRFHPVENMIESMAEILLFQFQF